MLKASHAIKPQRVTYGGQALIEGVMIRGVSNVSVAVRNPEGEIIVTTESIGWSWARRLRRLPLVRGVLVLAEMLTVGTRALLYSAQVAAGPQKAKTNGAKEPVFSSIAIGGTLAVSLALTIGLFFALPVFATQAVDSFLGDSTSTITSNIVEGLIRLAIFLIYIGGIGFMPEVRRVFAYHGAEHMAVHAQEHGDPMTLEAIRKYPTAHPRCGTAFILVVLVVAILVHIAWTPPVFWERMLSRIVLLPVIAGVSYEMIRWSGMHAENVLVKALIAPNLLLQGLTTRRPDDGQIEVAIKAVEAAVAADQRAPAPAGVAVTSLAEGGAPATGLKG